MKINELLEILEQYKGTTTYQTWIMNKPPPSISFKNDYIEVLRLDTSNRKGGFTIDSGKQWSIIIDKNKDFEKLPNWIVFKEKLGDNIQVTKIKKGKYSGKYGIRLYKMSVDIDKGIIKKILDFIFESVKKRSILIKKQI